MEARAIKEKMSFQIQFFNLILYRMKQNGIKKITFNADVYGGH